MVVNSKISKQKSQALINKSMYNFNKLCIILSLFVAFTLAFTLLASLIFPLGCMVSPETQNMIYAALPTMMPAEWGDTDYKTIHHEMYNS
jgi:hypothetical protein